MKTLKRFLAAVAVVLSFALSAGVANAQVVLDSRVLHSAQTFGVGIGTISTDTALVVRFIPVGLNNSGKVAVAAGGDITFTDGVDAAEAATATFECPVSGGLGGVIDVSDTACDTLGEVADVINASSSVSGSGYWRAAIVGGLRTDSSDNTLTTISATDANAVQGLALKWDGAVFLAITVTNASEDMRDYLDPVSFKFRAPAQTQSRPQLLLATANFTGTGASTFQVFGVTQSQNDTTRAGGSTVRTLYSIPGAATTVQFTPTLPSLGILGNVGEKLVVRYKSATTYTAGTLSVYGITYSNF